MTSSYVGVGVMSGTSLDGVDLCCVRFSHDPSISQWSYQILHADTIAYSAHWRRCLQSAHTLSGVELSHLNVTYSRHLAEVIQTFIQRYQDLGGVGEEDEEGTQPRPNIQFIACHGHTVLHQPERNLTLQICDGETLSALLDRLVVCNFRCKDVALGGQGAPLVPCGERYLFPHYTVCINLGGIANVSVGGRGWDVCVCNMLLNSITRIHDQTLEYDKDGALAESGAVIPELLGALNQLPYHQQPPPKSLGLEWFEANVWPLIDSKANNPRDLLRTAVEHIAAQITRAITQHGATLNHGKTGDTNKILITGGGAMNAFLMRTITTHIAQQTKDEFVIEETNSKTIEYKEALVFAFLGLRTLKGLTNIDCNVTGSNKSTVSGSIHLPATSNANTFALL